MHSDSSLNITEMLNEYREIIKKPKCKKKSKRSHKKRNESDSMWSTDEYLKNINTDKLLDNLTDFPINRSTSVTNTESNHKRSGSNTLAYDKSSTATDTLSNNLVDFTAPDHLRLSNVLKFSKPSKRSMIEINEPTTIPQLPSPLQMEVKSSNRPDLQADIFVKYLNKSMKVNADMRSHTDIDLEKNNNFMYFLTKTSMQSLKEKKI